MMDEKHLTGRRIGFFGKGGAGKSTILVLMAGVLARRGYNVCVLDADSTNIGLHRALGLERPPEPLIDFFGGMVFSGGAVTCPVDDPTPLMAGRLAVDGLPSRYAGRTPDGEILFMQAGKLGDKGPGAGCDGPLVKIARDLSLDGLGEHPVTLIDFKAGFEDSARGAITTLDEVIVVVDPTQAGLEMAAHMTSLVSDIKAGGLPATEHLENLDLVEIANRLYRQSKVDRVVVVLNKVPDDGDTEGYMRDRLAAHGIDPLAVIHVNPALGRAWLRGEPLGDAAWMSARELEPLVDALERMPHPAGAV